MVARATGLDTVFVRVVSESTRSLEQSARETSTGDDVRRAPYLALVYSQLALPISMRFEPSPEQPTEWAGDPLVGVEPFYVHWGRYSEYLASYLEGEKAALTMERRLFDALPRGLSAILSGEFGDSLPTRTWFHSEAPELAELPWELVAFANGHRSGTGGSFVRGVPPESASPVIPVSGRLRLGIVDPHGRASGAFKLALSNVGERLEVVPLSGGVRRALQQATEQGLELVHIVADGSVTSSYDGVLEIPGTGESPLGAGEVAALIRGSRIRLIGLTPPADNAAMISVSGLAMPVAHRAFTYFATSSHALPSAVAPLGPMNDVEAVDFWTSFYGSLGETLEIEGSMAIAQRRGISAVALFLRQLQPATFRRVAEVEQPHTDPSVADADLASSRDLVQQFESLKTGLAIKTPSLDKFVKSERRRQSKLAADVSEWIEGVDEK